jgi:monoamine oxidase
MDLTRRRFLAHLAAVGGAPLVYDAMTGLGLLAAPTQAPFDLTGRVSGVRVVILGAGLAGMTVAYELGKVGYDCRVLEARARPGGRVFTVRGGTASEEDGPGRTAAFDEGQYFNAGPMRISHHHQLTLAYCRELRVSVETFVADCESAYLVQTRGPLAGRRVRLREARADFDGYIAELLSKALSQAQLDQPLTAEDRDRLLAYLRRLGALDRQRQYRGSMRRGPDDRGRPSQPLALGDLLGIPDFYVQTDWSSQPTMMQVVGGMDRLPAALGVRLGTASSIARPCARFDRASAAFG